MIELNERSRKSLEGVHPDLVKVVELAAQLISQKFIVICGVRTEEEQKKLYAQGRTAPGKIVTWTLKSRHLPNGEGWGQAVDIVPYPVDWGTGEKFDLIAQAILEAGERLGIAVRWGADWDQDGNPREQGETDSPHFELDEEEYPK